MNREQLADVLRAASQLVDGDADVQALQAHLGCRGEGEDSVAAPHPLVRRPARPLRGVSGPKSLPTWNPATA
jgi:hypothetical protein